MKIFSNFKELEFLLKNKKNVELVEEFQKTKLVERKDCRGAISSAKEMYRIICENVAKADKSLLTTINAKALDIFTQAWDAEALLMIKGDKRIFGVLNEEASKVLTEYDFYRKEAIKVLEIHYKEDRYSEILENGVEIIVKSGGVSFIREGKEYVVFFPEN